MKKIKLFLLTSIILIPSLAYSQQISCFYNINRLKLDVKVTTFTILCGFDLNITSNIYFGNGVSTATFKVTGIDLGTIPFKVNTMTVYSTSSYIGAVLYGTGKTTATISANAIDYGSIPFYVRNSITFSTSTFLDTVRVSSITLLNGDPVNGGFIPIHGGNILGGLNINYLQPQTEISKNGFVVSDPTSIGSLGGMIVYKASTFSPTIVELVTGGLPGDTYNTTPGKIILKHMADTDYGVVLDVLPSAGDLNFTPTADYVCNLGSATLRWKNGFIYNVKVTTITLANGDPINGGAVSAADFTNITTNIIQTGNNTVTRISSAVVMGYQIVKGSFSVIGNANITGWTVFNGSVTILTNGVIPLSLRNDAGSGKLINLWRASEYAGSIDVIDGPYNGIDITGNTGYGINFRPAANTLIRFTRAGNDTKISTYTANTGNMDFCDGVKANEFYSVQGSTFNGMVRVSSITMLDNSPVGGGGGAAGNANRNITFTARDFTAPGLPNNGVVSYEQYEINNSTAAQYYIVFSSWQTGAVQPHAVTEGVMDREWAGGAINVYVTMVTTGSASGNIWLDVCLSTAPFDANTYTCWQSTTGAPLTAWENGVVIATFTIPSGTPLAAGKDFSLKLIRRTIDGSKQDIYIKSCYFDYDSN